MKPPKLSSAKALQRLAPAVPIISEEQASRETPKTVERGSYFLVDPLDGTREFIAGRDEYTVNIALLSDGAPMLGIICRAGAGLYCGAALSARAPSASPVCFSGARPPHPRPAAPAASRARHHGQPVAFGSPNTGLCRTLSAGQTDAVRLLDKVLPHCGRLGRSLSAAGADPRLGCRRRTRASLKPRAAKYRRRTARHYATAPPDLVIPAFVASGQAITA